MQKKVVEVLKDTVKVKSSQMHPIEIFLAMKDFEKGGKYVFVSLMWNFSI